MKNKKIIFLVATVCCLVVCLLCFGAWTIADTSYQVSDFQYSYSTAYVYVVPSSNISVEEFSNLYVYCFYRQSNSLNYVYGYLSDFTVGPNGLYYISSTAYSSSTSTVTMSCTVSTIDTTNSFYYISTGYYVGTSPSLVNFTPRSNLATRSYTSSSYRTVVLFVDKISASGVPQEQYDELLQRYEDLEYDFSDLESDYDDLQIEVQEYIALYNQELAINTALNTRIEELQARIDSLESGGSALDFVGSAFEKVGDILQIEILPNITIGTIVAVPLILGVVFLVLRLVRGE